MLMVSHKRRFGVAAVLLATFLTTATPASAAQPSCRMEILPVPAETYRSRAEAIDPTGRFVAGTGVLFKGEESVGVAFRWDRGEMSVFGLPTLSSWATGVNRDGVVVGNGYAGGVARPWQYREGTVTHLPVVDPSHNTYVEAINGNGDMVGWGDSFEADSYVLLWPAAAPGTVQVLSAPPNAQATDITDGGRIVGETGYLDDVTGWVRAANGRIHDLSLPGASTVTVPAATGRWAVSRVWYGDRTSFVRWNLNTREHVALPDGLTGVADVNRHGVVVGESWIVREGALVPLPGGGDHQTLGARAVADNGTVAGFLGSSGFATAVRWIGC